MQKIRTGALGSAAGLPILPCTGGVSLYACRKMKFSSKPIARNTLKNKGRFPMGIIGVMGCVGVIIAAPTVVGRFISRVTASSLDGRLDTE